MAGGNPKIHGREEVGAVIRIDVRTMDSTDSLLSVSAVPRTDISGMVVYRDDGTNTTSIGLTTASSPARRVERTIDYAVSHHENLLRRLAD